MKLEKCYKRKCLLKHSRGENMDIKLLKEYTKLKKEYKDIEERKKILANLLWEAENTISEDVVKGSTAEFPYTQCNMHIVGVDDELVRRRKRALARQNRLLEEKRIEILENINKIEEFIESVEDSDVRMIIRLRIIDGLSWAAVGMKMYMNPDSCRKKLANYMKVKE